MRRRKFLKVIGGFAAAWPMTARAQQPPMKRIGALTNFSADDPEGQTRIGAFLQGLQEAGWAIGRNVRVDYRWAGGIELLPKYAAELVALKPDVVLANGNISVEAVRGLNRTLPIVFVAATDPIGAGFVESLARPGGDSTGFYSGDFGMSAKWLELLKDIAPRVTRVAVLQDPAAETTGMAQFAAIQSVAPSLGIELSPLFLRDADQLGRAIKAFAKGPNSGLIVTRTGAPITNRDLIIKLTAENRLPTIYPLKLFVAAGGLASYGPDIVDQYRSAAGYVDRILKGEKPRDLPVQGPTKFELVINLKTARTLALDIRPTLLARASEVIE